MSDPFNRPRGVFGTAPEEAKLPEEQWLDDETIIEKLGSTALDPEKCPLGGLGGFSVSYSDDRHVTLFVGSRGGKFESIAGPWLLSNISNVVMVDFKGEGAASTIRYRSEDLGHECIVLAPFGADAPWVEKFIKRLNPLSALIGSKHLISGSGVIADCFTERPSSGELHWWQREKKMLRAVIVLVLVAVQFDGKRNLTTVFVLISGAADELAEIFFLAAKAEKNKSISRLLMAAAVDLNTSSENELAGVFSGLRANLEMMELPEMQESTSFSDFELRDLKDPQKKITIYICLPTDQIPTCHKWISMILGLSFKEMERNPYKPRLPVTYLIDECAALQFCSPLLNAVSYIAGAGVKLIFFWQDASQGFAIYKERFNSFLANSGLILAWACSDPKTLSLIETRLGKTPVLTTRVNQDKKEAISGDTAGYEMVSLLTASEFRRHASRDTKMLVALINEEDSIFLERYRYWDPECPYHHLFAGKFDNYEQWRKEQG